MPSPPVPVPIPGDIVSSSPAYPWPFRPRDETAFSPAPAPGGSAASSNGNSGSGVTWISHASILCAFAAAVACQLQKASLVGNDAFAVLKADNHGNFITYSAFCEALRQLNLVGLPYGLSSRETEDLWMQADVNGNGVVEYEEFKADEFVSPSVRSCELGLQKMGQKHGRRSRANVLEDCRRLQELEGCGVGPEKLAKQATWASSPE
ncbi:unnamed protein product [Dovyalis caffra]|uniref:Calmodulin n=1 Tax=Dovyalis caffra TaxID=77055 RepID=A0AAV1SC81_9ROSI|nr:unnamed protein product [Dovyalis caffra]